MREVGPRLREYARHRASLDAAEAFDCCAPSNKLHFLHGFATKYEYLERVLGYGPHAAAPSGCGCAHAGKASADHGGAARGR